MATEAAPEANVSLQELQETVRRLSSHAGVQSVLILNRKGDILAGEATHAKHTASLLQAAKAHIPEDDEVSIVQVRSEKGRELLIAPHEGYVLAVLKET